MSVVPSKFLIKISYKGRFEEALLSALCPFHSEAIDSARIMMQRFLAGKNPIDARQSSMAFILYVAERFQNLQLLSRKNNFTENQSLSNRLC